MAKNECCGVRLTKNYCYECNTLYETNMTIKGLTSYIVSLSLPTFIYTYFAITDYLDPREYFAFLGAVSLGLIIVVLSLLQAIFEKLFKDNCNLLAMLFGCHQNPDRSIFIKGKKMSICARCVGMLVGTFLFIPVHYFYHFKVYILVLLSVPLILDGMLQYLTTYTSGFIRRISTGIMFSGILTYIVGYIYLLVLLGLIKLTQII